MKKTTILISAIIATAVHVSSDETTDAIKEVINFHNTTNIPDVEPTRKSHDNLDPLQVMNWLEAAENGDAESQYLLSLCYFDGVVTGENDAKAFGLALASAEQGYAPAQHVVGTSLVRGEGTEKASASTSNEWFTKAAEAGYAPSRWWLGWDAAINRSSDPIHHWKIAAEQGYYPAQIDLAVFYNYGLLVEQDIAEAIKWTLIAMVTGSQKNPDFRNPDDIVTQEKIDAAVNHTNFRHRKHAEDVIAGGKPEGFPRLWELFQGLSVDVHAEGQKRAAEYKESLWNLSAAQVELAKSNDHSTGKLCREAQRSLATAYTRGELIPQNFVMAYAWLSASGGLVSNLSSVMSLAQVEEGQRLAKEFVGGETSIASPETTQVIELAEAGNPHAQRILGWAYYSGDRGLTSDFKKAAHWFSRAAEQGEAGAQFDLGKLYDLGQGVERNMERAHELWLQSAQGGYSAAQNVLGQVVGIDKAEGREWFKKSALQGNFDSQNLLGMYHQYNTEDLTEAYKWFNLTKMYGQYDHSVGKRIIFKAEGPDIQFMHDEIKNYVDYMDTKHLLDSWTNDLNLEVKLSEQSNELLTQLVEYSKDPNKAILAKWYLLVDPNAVGPESIEMGYFRKFAELDNSLVQAAFARCYLEGNLVPRNLIIALKWAILAEDEDDQRQYETMFTPVAVHDKPYKRLPGSDTRPCESEIRALLKEMGGGHLIPLAEQLAADHKGN